MAPCSYNARYWASSSLALGVRLLAPLRQRLTSVITTAPTIRAAARYSSGRKFLRSAAASSGEPSRMAAIMRASHVTEEPGDTGCGRAVSRDAGLGVRSCPLL